MYYLTLQILFKERPISHCFSVISNMSRIAEIVESLFLSDNDAQRTRRIGAKAEELVRLASRRPSSVPAHALEALCVALACSVLNEAYVHTVVAKLAGMTMADFSKALHAMRLALQLGIGEQDVSFRQMSITFGCLHASSLAQVEKLTLTILLI